MSRPVQGAGEIAAINLQSVGGGWAIQSKEVGGGAFNQLWAHRTGSSEKGFAAGGLACHESHGIAWPPGLPGFSVRGLSSTELDVYLLS